MKQKSDITLFTAKQSFLDAGMMSQMFMEVYCNLGNNTKQFKRAKIDEALFTWNKVSHQDSYIFFISQQIILVILKNE